MLKKLVLGVAGVGILASTIAAGPEPRTFEVSVDPETCSIQSNYTQQWWNAAYGWGAWYTRQFPTRVETFDDVREMYTLIEESPWTEWAYRERSVWGGATPTREYEGYLNWRAEKTAAQFRVEWDACHRERAQAKEEAALKKEQETVITLTEGAIAAKEDWSEHSTRMDKLEADLAAIKEILTEVMRQLNQMQETN